MGQTEFLPEGDRGERRGHKGRGRAGTGQGQMERVMRTASSEGAEQSVTERASGEYSREKRM
jgi:hypothetical protein